MIKKATLGFLRSLGENNDKAWFEDHRDVYDVAKADAIDAASMLLEASSRYDPAIGQAGLDPAKCVKRIHRDPRFNKGKPPYKTELLIIFNAENPIEEAGYYLHVEPGNCHAGASLFLPSKPALDRMRRTIADNPKEWDEIQDAKPFRDAYPDGVTALDELKNVPSGFDSDSPAASWLKMKGYGVAAHVNHTALTGSGGLDHVIGLFAAARPLLEFLNRDA